jgi:hypothetical protein
MKTFASIILLFLVSIGNLYSQTPLEKEVLNQLNIYRKQHGLNPVQIDTTISRIARYHTEYLVQCHKVRHVVHYDKLPHDEQFDIKGFIERDFGQRVAMAPEKNIWSEIQMQAMCAKSGVSNAVIAKGIIEAFDSSPNHKEIMLCEDVARLVNVVGISVIQTEKNDNGYDEYVVNINFGSSLIL